MSYRRKLFLTVKSFSLSVGSFNHAVWIQAPTGEKVHIVDPNLPQVFVGDKMEKWNLPRMMEKSSTSLKKDPGIPSGRSYEK